MSFFVVLKFLVKFCWLNVEFDLFISLCFIKSDVYRVLMLVVYCVLKFLILLICLVVWVSFIWDLSNLLLFLIVF